MACQYKDGDKVRIKERKGLKEDYPFPFGEYMSCLAGVVCRINKISPVSVQFPKSRFYNSDDHMYELCPIFPDSRDFMWAWHSSMFEPVLEDSASTTFTSLKEGDLLSICGMVGRIQYSETNSVYYLNFDLIDKQEHFTCCKKLEELVLDFRKIANEFNVIRQERGCFPEFSTISDLVKFVQAVNNVYNSKKSITTPKTLNENEIRFQKPKTSSIRGSVPTGRAICGRRCKTAIELGHLSNTTCYC